MSSLSQLTPDQLRAALQDAAAQGDIETLRAIEQEARGRMGLGQPPVQQPLGGLRQALGRPPVPEPMAQLETAMRAARVPGSVAMLPGGQYEVTQWTGGEKAIRQVRFAQYPGLGLTTQGRLIVPQAGETQAQTAAQALGQYFEQPLRGQAPWSEFVAQHPYIRTAVPSAQPYGDPQWTEAPPSGPAMAHLQSLERLPGRVTPEEVAARPEMARGLLIGVQGWKEGIGARIQSLLGQVGWGVTPGGAIQAPVGAAKFLGRERIGAREFPTRMTEIIGGEMMTAKFAPPSGEPVTGLRMRTAIAPGAPVGPGITPVLSSAVENVLLMRRKFEREPLSWEQFQGFKRLVKPGTGVRPGQPVVSIGGLETGLSAAGRTQELYLEALRVNLPATAQVGRYLQREFPEQFGALSELEQKLMLTDPKGGRERGRWLQTGQQLQLPGQLRLGGGVLRGAAWSSELEVAYQEIYPWESGLAVGGVPLYKGVYSRQTALDLDLPGVQMILAGEGVKGLPTITAMLAQNVPREQWLKMAKGIPGAVGVLKEAWPEGGPFRIGAQPEIEETMRKMLFTKGGQAMLRGKGVLRTRPWPFISRDPLEIAAYQRGGALEGQAKVTPLEGEAARIETIQDILVGDLPVYPTSYPGRAAPGRMSATDLAELAKYDPETAKDLWQQGRESRAPAMGVLQAIFGQARDPRKLSGFMMPTAAAQELAGERAPTDVETWQALAQEYGAKPLEVPLRGAGPPGMKTLQLPGPEYARTLSHQLRTGEEVTAFGRGYLGILRALGGEEEAPTLGEAVQRYLPAAAKIGRSQELIRRAFGGEQELSASATVLTDPSLKLGEIGVGSEVARRLGIRPGERTAGLLRRWPTLFSSVTQKMGLGTRVMTLEEIAEREGSKIDPAGSPHSIYVSSVFETPGQLDYDKDTATIFRLLKSGRDVLAKQMPAYTRMISQVADMVTRLDPGAQERAGAGASPEQIIGQASGIGPEKYAKGLEPRRLSQVGSWQEAFFGKGTEVSPEQQAQAMAAQRVGKGIVGQVNIMLQNYRYMMDVYGIRGGEQEQAELELSRIQQTALDRPGASMQELQGKFGDILRPFLYSPMTGRSRVLGETWETETGRLARSAQPYAQYGDISSWIRGASQAGLSAGTIETLLRAPGGERSEQMLQAVSGVMSGRRGAISELGGLLPREAYERTIQGRLSRAWGYSQLERRLAYEEDPEKRAEIEHAMRLPSMQAAAPLAQELMVARAIGTTRAGVATFPQIAQVAPRLGGAIGYAARGALEPPIYAQMGYEEVFSGEEKVKIEDPLEPTKEIRVEPGEKLELTPAAERRPGGEYSGIESVELSEEQILERGVQALAGRGVPEPIRSETPQQQADVKEWNQNLAQVAEQKELEYRGKLAGAHPYQAYPGSVEEADVARLRSTLRGRGLGMAGWSEEELERSATEVFGPPGAAATPTGSRGSSISAGMGPAEQDAEAIRLASEASERRSQRPGTAGGQGPPQQPPGTTTAAPPTPEDPLGLLGGLQPGGRMIISKTEEGNILGFQLKQERLNQEHINRLEDVTGWLEKWGKGIQEAAESTEKYDKQAQILERDIARASQYWQEAEKIRQMPGGTLGAQGQVAQRQALIQRIGAAGVTGLGLEGAAQRLEFMQPPGMGGEGVRGFFQQAGGILPGMGQALGGAARQAVSGWGLIYLNRMRSLFMQPVQRAMREYAGQQLGAQQAMYMGGMPIGMEGAPAGILAGQARMGQFRMGVGEAGWQAWGGMAGQLGGQAGPLGPGLAIGGPALGAGLMAAYLAPSAIAGPVGVGVGLGVAGIGAAGYVAGAARDREAMALAQARMPSIQEAGVGGWLGGLAQNFRGIVGQGWASLTGQLTPQQMPGLERYGQQIMAGNLPQLGPAGQMQALQYFTEQRLGPQLPTLQPQQLMQLTGAYMGMTGQQDIGQFNQPLMVAGGQRAQMLGVPMGQAFQPWQQMAAQMGFAPMSQEATRLAQQALLPQRRRIGGIFEEAPGMAPTGPSERDIQQQLYEQQQIAPFVREFRGRWGRDITEEAMEPLIGAGRGPQRFRMQQFLAGNRQIWSDMGRTLGRQEWVTMEEGGLPIFTTEMRDVAGQMRGAQRGYRDWQWQQQGAQLGWQGQYMMGQGGMWDIQNRMRGLQGQQQQWQFGFAQRQFNVAGAQWQEQFNLQGQQWQQNWGLNRQIFEQRVGWQQQDIGQQQQRAATQFGWRMQDWGYQENVSQLQAGWQQEDIQEAIRFSSGRQRRRLQQQQERMTILESMRREHHDEQKDRMETQREWQEEDFEKQRERNEKLIELQRERFELQKRHFEENREMQQRFHEQGREMGQERLDKQQEFYHLGRELEEERIDMQRRNWKKQHEWAVAAHTEAGKYNKEMDKLQDQYRKWQEKQADTIANFQRLSLYLDESEESMRDIVDALLRLSGGLGGGLGRDPRHPQEHQLGGPIIETETGTVHQGEYVVPRGGALVKSDETSSKLLSQIYDVLVGIHGLQEQGMNVNVAVVGRETRPQEHVLTLEDSSYANWPR